MKTYETKNIRNISLVGGSGSGKTTLAESMLLNGKSISRVGAIEKKNTISDFQAVEHERGLSVYSSVMHAEWEGHKINFIDTPGMDDFVGALYSAIRIAGTTVMLIDAQNGYEVGTELTWQKLSRIKKPMILAVNQLEHNSANWENTVDDIKNNFGSAVAIAQYPVATGSNFTQIIDLIKMKMITYDTTGGLGKEGDIPEDQMEQAEQMRNELIEKSAECDEAIMEKFFEEGTLSETDMLLGIKQGIINHMMFPVFCISGIANIGVDRLMSFINASSPCPADMPAEKTEDEQDVICDASGETILYVYKTLIEQNLGQLSFFKVMSGTLKQGDSLKNSSNQQSEIFNQLFAMNGKERVNVDSLSAGDMGCTLKLKNSSTSDTLDKGGNTIIKTTVYPSPRMFNAMTTENKQDNEKIVEGLKKINAQDPTLKAEYSNELKQLVIYSQGEMHLSVAKWLIKDQYNIDVQFIERKIPYRETISGGSSADYRHKKQSGGSGQFGEVHLRVEAHTEGMPDPEKKDFNVRDKQEIQLDWGGKLIFYNCIVGGVIDARYIPAIQKGVMEKMEEGPLTGSCVRDVRVMVYDGKMHPVDSNDVSFKIAGSHAFKTAFRAAQPQLLEPVQLLSVTVPEEMMGDVMTDLQGRRAVIQGMDSEGKYQIINAKVPLAELYKYATSLRSLSQGRGNFTTEFAEYAIVPFNIQEELVSEYTKEEVVEA